MADVVHTRVWGVAEAKAHLSELLDHVINDGPQAITRHGQEIALVVSVEEWHSKSRRPGSLADFLAASPLRDSGVDNRQPVATARDVAL